MQKIGAAGLAALNARGPAPVLTAPRPSGQARSSTINTFHIHSTEPRKTADEVMRRQRQRAFLMGTR
jgi:hypothetical protein